MSAAVLASALLFGSPCAKAQWEPVVLHHGVWGLYVTPSGNILYADYRFDGSGGIYTSTDGGATFEKTFDKDHTYNRFYQFGELIYATGNGAKIARSDNDGKTWALLDYSTPDGEEITDAEYTACYGMAEKDERLYLADFGAGILYSDDYGDTWHFTDRTSLAKACGGTGEKDEKGNLFTENFYTPYVFKDKVYEFGANYICRYDEDKDQWSRVRAGSNFMVSLAERNDTLFCGRSVDDYNLGNPFLQYTTDGETWTPVGRPEGQANNYVRSLVAHGNLLFVGHIRDGVYVSDDGGATYVTINEGLPVLSQVSDIYLPPLEMVVTDDYLYASLFDAPDDATKGGLYRFPLSQLPSHINEVKATFGKVRFSEGSLVLDGTADKVEIYDLAGASRLTASHTSRVDLASLPSGTYVYKVVKGKDSMKGKIAKP